MHDPIRYQIADASDHQRGLLARWRRRRCAWSLAHDLEDGMEWVGVWHGCLARCVRRNLRCHHVTKHPPYMAAIVMNRTIKSFECSFASS